jgi:hypothetical protein
MRSSKTQIVSLSALLYCPMDQPRIVPCDISVYRYLNAVTRLAFEVPSCEEQGSSQLNVEAQSPSCVAQEQSVLCGVPRAEIRRTSLKRLERFSPSLLSYRTCAFIAVQLESLNQRSRSRRSSASSSGAVRVGHGASFSAVPSTLAAQKRLIETICATSERASGRS